MCSNIEFQSNVCDLTSENIEFQSKNLDFDQNKNYYPITPKSLKSSSSSSSRSSKSSTSSSPAPFTSSSVREESQQKSFHVVGSDPQRESKIQQSQRHSTLPPYQHQEYPAINHPTPFFGLQNANRGNMSGLLSLEHYRLQLYNYAMVERLRNATAAAANSPYTNTPPSNAPAAPRQQTSMDGLCSTYPPVIPYGPRFALSMSLFHNSVFQPEEPKPQHSYIGLIAMAILSTPEHKLVLSDIYQHILDNYPYFRTRGPGWRNSIRHNLSLNDCFIKAGRSANGKGHYWAIHPANIEDFKKGDFRRRKAQRKVRKHMGLAVDDDGADSPSPPPLALTPPPIAVGPHIYHSLPHHQQLAMASSQWSTNVGPLNAVAMYSQSSRKRQFDVASLLAPDDETNFMKSQKRMSVVPDSSPSPSSFIHQAATPTNSPPNTAAMNAVNNGSDLDEDIDVVANDDLSSQGTDSVLDRNLNSVDVSGNSSLGAQKGENVCSEESAETGDEKMHHEQHQHQEKNVNESWNSLIQQFPMDPRILGRYYGQYMAAAQQRVASKRFINSINQHSPEEGQSSALPAASPTNKHCSE